MIAASDYVQLVRLRYTERNYAGRHKLVMWFFSVFGDTFVHEANSHGPSGRPDLDCIPHVLPPLGAIQVTDVIQRSFSELDARKLLD
jgi:hypothetical protein